MTLRSQERMFRISRSRGDDGRLSNGSWHPDARTNPGLRLRYLCIEAREELPMERLTGYLKPETFTAVMRALVSIDYDTPNWCEKCHLAGHDGCCRCEIASNN